MTELELNHKNEVEKLRTMEDELSELILKTENLHLMTAFNDWQEQRVICNELYVETIQELFESANGNEPKSESANLDIFAVSGMLPDEDNVKLKDNGFGALEAKLGYACKHRHAAITPQGWKCTECGKLVG